MTTRSTQGKTVGYVQESALGTNGGSFAEIRFDEFTFPTSTKFLMANPNVGHQHAFDIEDLPIVYDKYTENAITLKTKIRQAAANETAPPIADFFESMGCVVASNAHTTVATYASTTSWTLTAVGAAAVGQAGLMELNSGIWYPVLCAEYVTETRTVTPSMALPSASLATNEWQPMTTMYPRSQPVPATKTLAFEVHTRAQHTSGEDLAFELQGCACQSVGNLVLRPSEAPTLEFKFCMGKNPMKSDAIANETYKCGEKFPIVNDDFRVEFADAAAAGAIARADSMVVDAEVTFGFSNVPIPGEGSGVFAGMQGYILHAAPPKIKLSGMFDIATWTALEGSNTPKYIGLVQPTRSLLTPAFGFWMPNAYLDPDALPSIDFQGKDYIIGTATYIGSCAGYSEDVLNAAAGAAPWFFAISGHYIA